MNDMILWIVALGIGGLGLLLLGVAGVAAAAISSAQRGRRATEAAPPARRAAVSPASGAGRPAGAIGQDAPDAAPDATGTLWAWVKACVFALIHAGVVSFVLGGLTFFEDLVRANGEIRRSGNVSFPRQLLPPSLGGNQPSGADETIEATYSPRYRPAGALRERDLPPISAAEWKVVDILDEAGPAGEALVGDYRPRPH
jgi:hypothetical protein